MKNIIAVSCIIFTSFAFSQKGEKPNHPIKDLKIIKEIKADFDNDGKIDKVFLYKGLKNYSYSGTMGEDDTIHLIRVVFSTKKLLETKPIKLEYGKIDMSYNKKSNKLSINLSLEDEAQNGISRFSTIDNIITLKYDHKISNFIAVKSKSYSLNLTIESDYIKKIKKYYNEEDLGYSTLINDEKGNDVWLKKINYKESINTINLKFTEIDFNTFKTISENSKGFKAYVIKEIKNPLNRN